MTRLRRARLAGALVALGIYCYVVNCFTTPLSAGRISGSWHLLLCRELLHDSSLSGLFVQLSIFPTSLAD